MVTLQPPVWIGTSSVKLQYSSDLADPVFYIYIDGKLAAETTDTQYIFTVEADEVVFVEILDDPDDIPQEVFPSRFDLCWYPDETAEYYNIYELVGAEWLRRARLRNTGGYLLFKSRQLEDGQEHTFRVVAVSEARNEGEAGEFSAEMVRNPDKPAVEISFNDGDYKVTGTLTPDITGVYYEAGQLNGRAYYARADEEWFIWYDGSGDYFITPEPGVAPSANIWHRASENPEGTYNPVPPASGTATVSVSRTLTISES